MLEHERIDLIAVYTQPDRKAGRHQKIMPSPVKLEALKSGINTFQPASLKNTIEQNVFLSLGADLLVVAAYGLILPKVILDSVQFPINVHASLLPRWRGAAPIQRAIMAGDTETGISIMRIVEELDAGPVWLKQVCAIDAHETGGEMLEKLSVLGASTISETIDMILNDTIEETPQKHSLASYASKITARDRWLSWQDSAKTLAHATRALAPIPAARAQLGPLSVKILEATEIKVFDPGHMPGSILNCSATGIDIATGNGILRVTKIQPAGKKIMDAAQFSNGYGMQF